MPTQNMSKRIGTSSAPVINRVIQDNKNVQQPCGSPQAAVSQAFNKHPVKVGK